MHVFFVFLDPLDIFKKAITLTAAGVTKNHIYINTYIAFQEANKAGQPPEKVLPVWHQGALDSKIPTDNYFLAQLGQIKQLQVTDEEIQESKSQKTLSQPKKPAAADAQSESLKSGQRSLAAESGQSVADEKVNVPTGQ